MEFLVESQYCSGSAWRSSNQTDPLTKPTLSESTLEELLAWLSNSSRKVVIDDSEANVVLLHYYDSGVVSQRTTIICNSTDRVDLLEALRQHS